MKLSVGRPDMTRAVRKAEGPGRTSTPIPASRQALINLCPGSARPGIGNQGNVLSPFKLSEEFFPPGDLVVLMVAGERGFNPIVREELRVCLVSSAAMRSTSFKVSRTRRVISLRFPMGVAQTKSFPLLMKI